MRRWGDAEATARTGTDRSNWPTRYYPPVETYEPWDEMCVGDVVELDGNDRLVTSIRRTPHDDAIRNVTLNRLRCGYSRGLDGRLLEWCDPEVIYYRSDLKQMKFGGWKRRRRNG